MDKNPCAEPGINVTDTTENGPHHNLGYRLYSTRQIFWGTFFFGALAGMAFLSRNFKKMATPMQQNERVSGKYPCCDAVQFIPIIMLPPKLFLLGKPLGNPILDHIAHIADRLGMGYKKHSTGRIIGTGLLLLASTSSSPRRPR